MTDLSVNAHNHGESGTKPPDSKDWSVGDGLEAEYVDWLYDLQRTDEQQFVDAIVRRTDHIDGDLVVDGLVASTGSNAREVDVTSSTGAYVDGQFTESISSTTVTLSTNGTGSLRTDSIWVDETGQIGKSEDATSVASDQHKIAEVDVTTGDSIDEIRNTARRVAHFFVATDPDGTSAGDYVYDDGNDEALIDVAGTRHPLFFKDGSQALTGDIDLDGNSITDSSGLSSVDQATLLQDVKSNASGGTVPAGEWVSIGTFNVPDGDTLAVTQATLTKDGFTTACESGVDLRIIPEGASAASDTELVLSGDGSTLHDDETGNPHTSYTNTSGSAQTVAIGLDNGDFGSGFGSEVNAHGEFVARVH